MGNLNLTKTEKEVLYLYTQIGLNPKQIARRRKTTIGAVYKIIRKLTKKERLPKRKYVMHRNDKFIRNLKELKRYQSCLFCEYSTFIQLHHIKPKEDTIVNLIPVCPNHHQEIHHIGYSKEMIEKIKIFLLETILNIIKKHNEKTSVK